MTAAELTDFASRNPMLVGMFVILTIAIIANEVMRLTRGFSGISAVQLTRLLNSGDGTVIDVSPAVDYAKGHIEGAKNVPMSTFDVNHKLLANSKEKPVVVVCRKGMTATEAAKKLKKAGFANVSILEGGVEAWANGGNLLVTGKKPKG